MNPPYPPSKRGAEAVSHLTFYGCEDHRLLGAKRFDPLREHW
jgi:hypothetical protein